MWCAIYIKDGGDGELAVIIWPKCCICRHYCSVNLDNAWHLLFFFFLLQVTDLTLARENQNNFEDYLRNNTNVNPGIDLTVTVLTTGFWPSYKSFDLSLPPEMVTFTCLDDGHVKISTANVSLL